MTNTTLNLPAAPKGEITRSEACELIQDARGLLRPFLAEGPGSRNYPANLAHNTIGPVVRSIYGEYPLDDVLAGARHLSLPEQYYDLTCYVQAVCGAIAE